ncbi:hypothetical protein DIPPA_19643 [Diplonema papillatum]|nr:hypothetical protein DIPPA_19643 [Diplonema papillatum]
MDVFSKVAPSALEVMSSWQQLPLVGPPARQCARRRKAGQPAAAAEPAARAYLRAAAPLRKPPPRSPPFTPPQRPHGPQASQGDVDRILAASSLLLSPPSQPDPPDAAPLTLASDDRCFPTREARKLRAAASREHKAGRNLQLQSLSRAPSPGLGDAPKVALKKHRSRSLQSPSADGFCPSTTRLLTDLEGYLTRELSCLHLQYNTAGAASAEAGGGVDPWLDLAGGGSQAEAGASGVRKTGSAASEEAMVVKGAGLASPRARPAPAPGGGGEGEGGGGGGGKGGESGGGKGGESGGAALEQTVRQDEPNPRLSPGAKPQPQPARARPCPKPAAGNHLSDATSDALLTNRLQVFREVARRLTAALPTYGGLLHRVHREFDRGIQYYKTKSADAEARAQTSSRKEAEARREAGEMGKRLSGLDAGIQREVNKMFAQIPEGRSGYDLAKEVAAKTTDLEAAKRRVAELEGKLSLSAQLKTDFDRTLSALEETFRLISEEKELRIHALSAKCESLDSQLSVSVSALKSTVSRISSEKEDLAAEHSFLLARLELVNDARRTADAQVEDLRAENNALQLELSKSEAKLQEFEEDEEERDGGGDGPDPVAKTAKADTARDLIFLVQKACSTVPSLAPTSQYRSFTAILAAVIKHLESFKSSGEPQTAEQPAGMETD